MEKQKKEWPEVCLCGCGSPEADNPCSSILICISCRNYAYCETPCFSNVNEGRTHCGIHYCEYCRNNRIKAWKYNGGMPMAEAEAVREAERKKRATFTDPVEKAAIRMVDSAVEVVPHVYLIDVRESGISIAMKQYLIPELQKRGARIAVLLTSSGVIAALEKRAGRPGENYELAAVYQDDWDGRELHPALFIPNDRKFGRPESGLVHHGSLSTNPEYAFALQFNREWWEKDILPLLKRMFRE